MPTPQPLKVPSADFVIKFQAKEEERARSRPRCSHGLQRRLVFTECCHYSAAVLEPSLADGAILTQVFGQLGRIGGNVHQLVKLANRDETPWPEALDAAGKSSITLPSKGAQRVMVINGASRRYVRSGPVIS